MACAIDAKNQNCVAYAIASLKNCAKSNNLCAGASVHADILRKGLLGKSVFLDSALVNMYAKCGALGKANEVLDGIRYRNVVSWNALIAGYVQSDHGKAAVSCLESMQHEGISPDEVTFLSALKACGSIGALEKGSNIHLEIVQQGLLGRSAVLGGALVDMYAKCGAFARAMEVLEGLPARNVVVWNALLAGYARGDHGKEALDCFDQMQCQGHSPDEITFVCILTACSGTKTLDKGKSIHFEIVRQGLLSGSVVLGGAVVDMYVKCDALTKAKEVMEELPLRNVFSWNSLIAGYVRAELGKEALSAFRQMQHEGLSPDDTTYSIIMRTFGNVGSIKEGKNLHMDIVSRGFRVNDVIVGSALVDMYAKCGDLIEAERIFENLAIRNVETWNALIGGYAQKEQSKNVFDCSEWMKCEGHVPNAITFLCILKACGITRALKIGEHTHYDIDRMGLLDGNVVLGCALVDMYAKCGELMKAKKVLEGLLVQDVVCWNALIAGYVQENDGEEALSCFEQMQHEGFLPDTITFTCILKACSSIGAFDKGKNVFSEVVMQGLLEGNIEIGNALVNLYVKCGALVSAKELFEKFSVRNVNSWSTLISGYVQQNDYNEALNCFERMQGEGLYPDEGIIACILKACGELGALDKGEAIHSEIALNGMLDGNVVLNCALVVMYVECGALVKAREVHDVFCVSSVVSWNALIIGFVRGEHCFKAWDCFEQMQQKGLHPDEVTFLYILKACGCMKDRDKTACILSEIVKQGLMSGSVALGNALVDVYAKCSSVAKAKDVLEGLPVWDVVSWSALIAGYERGGFGKEALHCFEQMQHEGISPDEITFISITKACGSIGAFYKGRHMHSEIVKKGLLDGNIEVGGALVEMYARCGAVVNAREVLEGLPVSDVISWNALITGCAHGGYCMETLYCFEHMQQEGVFPDEITFLCVLNACCCLGLLDQGKQYFMTMSQDFGISPNVEHNTCMANLFGSTGLLKKALAVTEMMPLSNDYVACLSFLNVCKKWGNIELAKRVFEYIVQPGIKPAASCISMNTNYIFAYQC